MASMRAGYYYSRSRFGPSSVAGQLMPSADFCCEIKAPCGAFSHESATHSGSPGVSSTAFPTQPPEFTTSDLDGYDLRRPWPPRRRRMPRIRFLYIGCQVCSTLPPDVLSRRRPCASLWPHLHQVVKETFTPEL